MAGLCHLALLGCWCLLPGCVPYQPLPIDPLETSLNFTERSLDDPALRRFMAEQKSGHGAWGVARLAVAAAFFQGEVAVARAEAAAAAAGIETAGQSPNPVFSFAPGYNTSSHGISPWILAPTLDVTLETADKRGLRLAAARAQAEAAQLRVAAAAWAVRAKVRAAMLELHAAQENTALLRSEVALHELAITHLQALVNVGESPGFELTQERLGLSRTKLALHDAEKMTAISRAQLAAAIGVPAAALAAVTLDFSDFAALAAVPGAGLRRRALTHRADLLATLADYAVADAELRLEVAKQYPDVHLSPGYEFDQDDNKWSLGISVELPVFNQNRGPIAVAVATRKTARTKFEASQQAVFGQIEIALAGYKEATAKAATAAALAEQATLATVATEQLVNIGELGPLELTRRRLEASAAKLSQFDATIQAQQTAGELEAAVQVPLAK